jgi:sulfur transfer protein SufE
MSGTFLEKSNEVKKFFPQNLQAEARYKALIDLGAGLPPLPAALKVPENLVSGCQSNLYLAARFNDGLVYFEAASDALISAGLAALLIKVYSGETPETILKQPPGFLSDLGIAATLSANRSNGLAHIHLRMKQEALKFLVSLTIS